MSDEIHVSVNSAGPGRALSLYWRDPLTGKRKMVSAKTIDPREAERWAAVLQDELNSGRYAAPSKVPWAEFRQRYENEKLATLASKTRDTARTAWNHPERVLNPDRLAKLTTANMSRFQARLRQEGMTDVTIASHLRHLRPALSWTVPMGMLAKVPELHLPKRAKGQTLMRGRPITAEGFHRMLAAVPKVRPKDLGVWGRYLMGLWLSGLRLEESLALSWDQDESFTVDLTGRRPAFRIYAEAQNARRNEVLPMTPDFAQWLLQTPEADRHGRVFKVDGLKTGKPISPKRVCRPLSRIGRKAGVVLNKADGKYASAPDLRRSFGTRWAKRVMPAILKGLMRHASIETTMAYYVALDTADLADELWDKRGATQSQKAPSDNNPYNNGPVASQETEKAAADQSTEAFQRWGLQAEGTGLEPATPVKGHLISSEAANQFAYPPGGSEVGRPSTAGTHCRIGWALSSRSPTRAPQSATLAPLIKSMNS
jgi:integrase